MPDKILIHGLRVETVIGVYDWERTIRQPLVIDLELATDASGAAATDQISHALDYAMRYPAGSWKKPRRHLFNSLKRWRSIWPVWSCREFGVGWLQVRIMKPTAVPDADGVGVVIERGLPQ